MGAPLTTEVIQSIKDFLQIPVYECSTLKAYSTIAGIRQYLPGFYPGCKLRLDVEKYLKDPSKEGSYYYFNATDSILSVNSTLTVWNGSTNSGSAHIYPGYFSDLPNAPFSEMVPTFKPSDLHVVERGFILLTSGESFNEHPVYKSGTIVRYGMTEYIVTPRPHEGSIIIGCSRNGAELSTDAASNVTIIKPAPGTSVFIQPIKEDAATTTVRTSASDFPSELQSVLLYLDPYWKKIITDVMSHFPKEHLNIFRHSKSLYEVLEKIGSNQFLRSPLFVDLPSLLKSKYREFVSTSLSALFRVLAQAHIARFPEGILVEAITFNFNKLATQLCTRNFARFLNVVFHENHRPVKLGWITLAAYKTLRPYQILDEAFNWQKAPYCIVSGDEKIAWVTAYEKLKAGDILIETEEALSKNHVKTPETIGSHSLPKNTSAVGAKINPTSKAKLNFKPSEKSKIQFKVQPETKLKLDSEPKHDLPF